MKKTLCIALLLSISACSPKVENKGYVKQADLTESIKVGQTSKQEILDQFGSPSSQSSFGAETWYYISNRLETTAFLKPDVVEQDIIRIEFDANSMVSKIENYGTDKITDVKNVSRTTPAEGHTMGFIEQTLGNVGRFNKPGTASGTVAPGRQPSSGY